MKDWNKAGTLQNRIWSQNKPRTFPQTQKKAKHPSILAMCDAAPLSATSLAFIYSSSILSKNY